MAATIFVYYSTFESYALKPIVPPQIKKTPLPFLSHGSLRLFSYFFFLLSLFVLSLCLQFHQVFISKLLVLHQRRQWQPTPVFLPGESQGWGSLVGCRL